MTFASGLAACPTTVDEDGRLVESLRSGDERAFTILIDRYHNAMLRLATVYVRDPAVAQDVVQEAWLGVLRGLNRFRARSSLKTWILRILIYTAKTAAARESRTIPLSRARRWILTRRTSQCANRSGWSSTQKGSTLQSTSTGRRSSSRGRVLRGNGLSVAHPAEPTMLSVRVLEAARFVGSLDDA